MSIPRVLSVLTSRSCDVTEPWVLLSLILAVPTCALRLHENLTVRFLLL